MLSNVRLGVRPRANSLIGSDGPTTGNFIVAIVPEKGALVLVLPSPPVSLRLHQCGERRDASLISVFAEGVKRLPLHLRAQS